MRIGDAADRARLPTKTVRYYAEIGLVEPSGRRENGYRDYSATDVARLAFVRRARSFGFSIEDCRELLGLYSNGRRASADVKRIAETRIAELDCQMAELAALRSDLQRLADACHGNADPDCPIIEDLAGQVPVAS